MSRKINKKGRNAAGPAFVQVHHYVFDCHAYRHLTPLGRALLLELIRRYNGHNNGYIGLSARDAARACCVNKDTIKRAFDELKSKGFIQATQLGGFNLKDPSASRATEWRLTWHEDAYGRQATKEFMQWAPCSVREK